MEQLIAATVLIGDRSYRIRVAAGDEETVRKTVKTINDKIIEFKTEFAGKDMQDYIAMVLLWFATDQVANSRHSHEQEAIREKLTALESILDIQVTENQG